MGIDNVGIDDVVAARRPAVRRDGHGLGVVDGGDGGAQRGHRVGLP